MRRSRYKWRAKQKRGGVATAHIKPKSPLTNCVGAFPSSRTINVWRTVLPSNESRDMRSLALALLGPTPPKFTILSKRDRRAARAPYSSYEFGRGFLRALAESLGLEPSTREPRSVPRIRT